MSDPLQQARDGQHSHRQRVLILSNADMLVEGIKRSLADEPGVIISVAAPEDEIMMLEELNHHRPDVIILDAAAQISSPGRMLVLLKDYAQIRLVRVSSKDSLVKVYDNKKFVLKQLSDFVASVVSR